MPVMSDYQLGRRHAIEELTDVLSAFASWLDLLPNDAARRGLYAMIEALKNDAN